MDQKEWEERLDRAADRVSRAATWSVHVLEDAYVKGKETLQDDLGGNTRASSETVANENDASTHSAFTAEPKPRRKGTPRLGLMLVAIGFIWLLNSLGLLNQPIFPIMLMALGAYFIARSK